jgi:membrane associated rhomboid family serine protease
MANGFVNEMKGAFKSGDTIVQLIIINVIVFILVRVLGALLMLFNVEGFTASLTHLLAMPASIGALLFKPWTIITHMFLHVDFMHLLSNMLILYFGGQLFAQYLGTKRLMQVYILGGLCGAALFILAFNTLPYFSRFANTDSINFGASAATIAIFVAIASYVPDFIVRVFFVIEMRIKYLAAILVLLSLINIDSANAGGNIAHLGGALFGYIFTIRLRNGKETGNFIQKLSNTFSSFFDKKPKVVYTNHTNKFRNDLDYNATKKTNQELIDSILDKISKSGYDSLSKQEKEVLFKASKK